MRIGEVIRTEQLTPQLVRVVLGGEGLGDIEPTEATDAYVNCFFLPDAASHQVPFIEDEVRKLPREQRPFPRRITVRAWNAEQRELTLDIASHGAVGYAGRWAERARPGDLLRFKGPAADTLRTRTRAPTCSSVTRAPCRRSPPRPRWSRRGGP